MAMCNRIPVMVVVVSAVMLACLVGETLGKAAPPSSPSPLPSSSAPAPAGPDCLPALSNLLSCLDYVSPGSNLTSPGDACCKGFEGLVKTSPVCLCQLVANSSNSAASAFPIDRKRALNIPNACKLKVPPLTACAALGYPVPGAGFSAKNPSPASAPGGTEAPPLASGSPPSGTPETATVGAGKSDSVTFRPSVLISVLAALAVTGATIL